MRVDIFYKVKYFIHFIMSMGIGTEFCWVPSNCGLHWNEISDTLTKQGAIKNVFEISYIHILLFIL